MNYSHLEESMKDLEKAQQIQLDTINRLHRELADLLEDLEKHQEK